MNRTSALLYVMNRRRLAWRPLLGLAVVAAATGLGAWNATATHRYSEQELGMLRSLWIESLPEVARDTSNRYADDPRAAALGARIFFDARFSSNGRVSCATCHIPERGFTDGLPLAQGLGQVPRKTMTVVGTAHQRWLFWDGRKDSLWAQALGPLESLVEHGGTRTQYARLVAQHYEGEYEAIFGPLPDLTDRSRFPDQAGPYGHEAARTAWDAMRPEDRHAVTKVFVNIGKSIAAYERLLTPSASRFDSYVAAIVSGEGDLEALTADERTGMRLFIGEAGCTSCHNGPLFTNGEFHNTGVPQNAARRPDRGRAAGAEAVVDDEFNCRSDWSDAPDECPHLEYLRVGDHSLEGAFKVTTLRNIALTAPYMDSGQFASLAEVLRHYNEAPPASVGHSELEPLGLTELQLRQLEAFLRTLTGPAEMPDFIAP